MLKRKREISVALAEKGLSARELARKTGIHESHLSYLFRGRMVPTAVEAAKISAELDRDPKQLFENILG